ncbi:hypothetical protein B0T10DRAFT_486475 [Thelonectria olida]|uniref:NACHT domain-containing protein n=1 Tax=Thelonectria olida TaxID=1576542 RepID=A0A9P8W3E6_9HYPO|nr:hypothetical protein B0T10DRAFT_486475 [Thelonectria olida]
MKEAREKSVPGEMATASERLREQSDDLWTAAIKDLDQESQSRIDFNNDKIDVLNDLLAITDDAKTRMVDKSWGYTRKDGRKVFMRDIVARVAKWVNHFKEVGDTIVQYDPAHAALPWAGVRLLLVIATGDSNTYSQLLEATRTIAEVICRNALLEAMLKASSSPASMELRRALVKLYGRVLDYLGKAKAYYSSNSIKRVVKSAHSTDLESAMDCINQAQEEVDRCSDAFNLEAVLQTRDDVKRMLENFSAPVNRWNKSLDVFVDHLEATKRGDILRWISSQPFLQHHEQTKQEVLKDTGTWLLRHPAFVQWKTDSVSSILWLHGIPGSGKSKLTSMVIEDALATYQQKQGPNPVFFYCSRNTAEPERSDASAILASIVRQLSTPHPKGPLLPAMVKEYDEREVATFSSAKIPFDKSKKLVLQLLESYKHTAVTVVIDALDECNDRRLLLDWLGDILKESPCLLKIFVSSRDDGDIVYQLEAYANLTLSSDLNSRDIAAFAHSETKRLVDRGHLLRYSKRKEELRHQIIEEITSGAHGMFRWASLQLQALCEAHTDDAVIERLGRLPKDLKEAYQEIEDRLEAVEAECDRKLAQYALSWLLCAKEQLKSKDFLAAVCVTRAGRTSPPISKDQLLDLSFNLINYDKALDVFRFSHLSVQEFLEHHVSYQLTSANALVAEACLWHISNMAPLPSSISQWAEMDPLVRYPCEFWGDHAREAAEERQNKLRPILKEFFKGEHHQDSGFAQWRTIVRNLILDRYFDVFTRLSIAAGWDVPSPSALRIVCAFDLLGVFSIEEWTDLVNTARQDGQDSTPEEVMAYCGSLDLINWHFHHQLPFEITGEVLKAAARNETNGDRVLEHLLDHAGADINITEDVLIAAAQNQERSVEIMNQLLDTQIPVTEETVKTAAEHGDRDLMAMLLERRGHEFQITEETLKAAAENWEHGQSIIALLLDKGGPDAQITEDVIKVVGEYGAPETFAFVLDRRDPSVPITKEMLGTSYTMVKNKVTVLLDRAGADTAIHQDMIEHAVRIGSEGTTQLLLDRSEATNIKITEEIIKLASANFKAEALTLLLRRPEAAEIPITKEILDIVMANGDSDKKLQVLLNSRTVGNIPITENFIKGAARWGIRGSMPLLLDMWGPDAQITEQIMISATMHFGGAEIMTILLKWANGNIPITENVVHASAMGHNAMGKLGVLLQQDRCRVAAAITKKTCFDVARNGGSPELLDLLCEVGGFACGAAWKDISQFYHAVVDGDVEEINRLLQKQVTPTPNRFGNTPLHIAARKGHTEVVRILSRHHEVDVNSVSGTGQTPIMGASLHGHEKIVEILLAAGAKTHFIDIRGETATRMAELRGHEKVVQILFEAQLEEERRASGPGRHWRGFFIFPFGFVFLCYIFTRAL